MNQLQYPKRFLSLRRFHQFYCNRSWVASIELFVLWIDCFMDQFDEISTLITCRISWVDFIHYSLRGFRRLNMSLKRGVDYVNFFCFSVLLVYMTKASLIHHPNRQEHMSSWFPGLIYFLLSRFASNFSTFSYIACAISTYCEQLIYITRYKGQMFFIAE